MGKSFVNAALKNQQVLRAITLIVQAELEDLTAKLTEREAKLKSVEDENVQLVIKLGKLQLYLETADDVQKKCREEIQRLKDELQKSRQNLEEKDKCFKTLEKHCSHAIGDYTAENMVLKKSVAEKQAELEISNEQIDTLEQRVSKLEKLAEIKKMENLRLKQDIEEINSRQPENGSRSDADGKIRRNICTSRKIPNISTTSASLHVLSNSSPLSLPPPQEKREVSVRLTHLSSSVAATKNVGSSQKEVAITENNKHGDAKKNVVINGSKRHLCKCGLNFSNPYSLNHHISRKANIKNSNRNSTSSKEDARKVHKTISNSDCSKTGSQPLISSSPKTSNDTPKDPEHCAVNLDISGSGNGKHGRVHCKCGKKYYTKSALTKHILQQSTGKIFSCALCEMRFFHHNRLKRHMHGFHKKENYNGFGCRKCGKVFDNCNQLIIHRNKDH